MNQHGDPSARINASRRREPVKRNSSRYSGVISAFFFLLPCLGASALWPRSAVFPSEAGPSLDTPLPSLLCRPSLLRSCCAFWKNGGHKTTWNRVSTCDRAKLTGSCNVERMPQIEQAIYSPSDRGQQKDTLYSITSQERRSLCTTSTSCRQRCANTRSGA